LGGKAAEAIQGELAALLLKTDQVRVSNAAESLAIPHGGRGAIRFDFSLREELTNGSAARPL